MQRAKSAMIDLDGRMVLFVFVLLVSIVTSSSNLVWRLLKLILCNNVVIIEGTISRCKVSVTFKTVREGRGTIVK